MASANPEPPSGVNPMLRRAVGGVLRLWLQSAICAGILAPAICLTPSMAGAQESPSPEKLLAAGLNAQDVRSANLSPGGWWDDEPEFDGRLDPSSSPQLQDLVGTHVFGQPDDDPTDVGTMLSVFPDAKASAADFARRARSDKSDFGGTVDGPKVGDQSRYMRHAADKHRPAGASLRVRRGRYMFRIDANGPAAAVTQETLADLGRIVIDRLMRLDSGELAAPPLPEVAAALPDADAEFRPVMGTASQSGDVWVWVWSPQTKHLVASPRLRSLLHDGIGEGAGAMRRYGLAAHPREVVEVTVMPFLRPDAAAAYVAAMQDNDRPLAKTAVGGPLWFLPPMLPSMTGSYWTRVQHGRYVAEISCQAPYGKVSPDCRRALRDMVARLDPRLAALPDAASSR